MVAIYRLGVAYQGQAHGFGTAWIAGRREVVTAFHVVGSTETKTWLSDEADFEYHLKRGEGSPVRLVPVVADPQADIAVLRASEDLGEDSLPLAEAPPREGDGWSSHGYPQVLGDGFALSGKISAVKPGRSEKALQLLVDQGTDISWTGVSGAPVRVEGRVAGVVTRETGRASTLWASPPDALQELLRLAAGRDDFVKSCQEVLGKLYDSPDDLQQLAATLGWQAEGWAPEISVDEAAKQLSQRGFREGAKAFLELLRESKVDEAYGKDVDVDALEKRFQKWIEPQKEPFEWPSRASIVAKVIQYLAREEDSGVAVFQPLGFGGSRILKTVVGVLAEPGRKKLPVRLVPDRRRGVEEAKLYGKLLRDLRRGLERLITRPLPRKWAAAFPDDSRPSSEELFEKTLEDLLEGPVAEEGWTLILVMEELGRLETSQLQTWEQIFKRLVHAGGLPLKFLLLGGQELHDLSYGGSLDGDAESAWEDLKREDLGPLLRKEVESLVKEQNGDLRWVDLLLEVTGGHPALVEELMERGRQELSSADQEGLKDWVLASWSLNRLTNLVEQEEGLVNVLRRFANHDLARRDNAPEERLLWLGLVRQDGPSRWRWVTPVFADWVKKNW